MTRDDEPTDRRRATSVVSPAPHDYVGTVHHAIVRLMAILAVMLMPFGMGAAAAGVPGPHSAATLMQDCADQGHGAANDGGITECTMTCASALPAAAAPSPRPLSIRPEPARTAGARPLRDIHPEIATPPPKAS